MDDLISRQAAIDALDQIFDRCEEIEAHLPEGDPDKTDYKMYPDYMTVWKYLHQLPSVQQEITEEQAIEYLQNSGWMQNHDHEMYKMGLRERLADDSEIELAPTDEIQSAADREFIELVVEYLPPDLCPYKEYVGKPYFSIKYTQNGETFVGFGTYKPEVLSKYLKEYFMRSIQPEQRWTPVSKKSPDVAQRVLLSGHEQVMIGMLHSFGKYSLEPTGISYIYPKDDIKAWMPLPEPYKAESEDKK